MTHSSIILFGLFASFAAAASDPFFIVQHGGALVSTRLDNIINPGAVSSHQHAIIGGSNFGPDYSYDVSMQSSCSTANLDNDHSNYWVPDLYRKQSGGKFKHVGLSYARTYYLTRRSAGEAINEFPTGFRMMAGSAGRSSYNATNKADLAVNWICLGGKGNNNTPDFPKQQCPYGLRADLFFPNCWDGKNNWLEGNKHVAYPAEGTYDSGGKCPASHPKRIMSVFYEFIFHDDDAYEAGQRVLATGDDVGYSMHADWTNGWPQGFFTEVLSYGATCAVGDSVENCPATKKHMKIPNPGCTYNGLVVDEDWGKTNLLSALPGNNPVWGTSAKVSNPNYVEKAVFVRTGDTSNKIQPSGPGTPYAQINAGNYLVAKVGNDPAPSGATSISGNGATMGAGTPAMSSDSRASSSALRSSASRSSTAGSVSASASMSASRSASKSTAMSASVRSAAKSSATSSIARASSSRSVVKSSASKSSARAASSITSKSAASSKAALAAPVLIASQSDKVPAAAVSASVSGSVTASASALEPASTSASASGSTLGSGSVSADSEPTSSKPVKACKRGRRRHGNVE